MSRDRSPMRMRTGYYHPDLGDDPLPDQFRSADAALAKKMGEFLLEHFPGHPLRAEVDHRQGIASIWITELMGGVNRYILHIDRMKNYNDFLREMNEACGQILERYRLPRHRFSRDEWRAAIAKAPIIGLSKAPVPE